MRRAPSGRVGLDLSGLFRLAPCPLHAESSGEMQPVSIKALGCPGRGLLASRRSKGALFSPRGGGAGGMEKTEQFPTHWAGM